MRHVNILLIGCFFLLLFLQGCSDVPDLFIINQTSSNIGIVSKDRIVSVRPSQKYKLPGKPAIYEREFFDAIIIRNDISYGFSFRPSFLRSFGHGVQLKYYFILQEDGNLYCADSASNAVPASPQPPGFPIRPKIIK